jgi:Cu(I)/Ag(I) efflux system membrane fusion protein
MFVNVTLGTAATDALVVPTEALIRTGTRTVVIVDDGSGAFRPTDVETGAEADGNTEIRRGLAAGQRIVVSGQFLLDSEASLRATTTRMQDATPSSTVPREHVGEGRVSAIGDGTVTLSHGPIPTIQWGAMTMEFILPPGARPDLRPDEHVRFAFTMGDDGKPRLTRIEPDEAPK